MHIKQERKENNSNPVCTRGYQKVLSLTWKEPEIWIYSALFFNVVPFQLHTLVPYSTLEVPSWFQISGPPLPFWIYSLRSHNPTTDFPAAFLLEIGACFNRLRFPIIVVPWGRSRVDYSFPVPKNRRHNLLGGPGGFELLCLRRMACFRPSIPVYSPDHKYSQGQVRL